jgi:putative ABC transport system substrate-binding protein
MAVRCDGKSLARPGSNMTGFFLDIPEMSGKQLGLLREVLPHLSRLAIIGIPGLNAVQFAATEATAKAVGLEAEILEVRSPDDFEGAIETAKTKHADAGVLLSSPLVHGQMKHIAELALAKRLPLFACSHSLQGSGGSWLTGRISRTSLADAAVTPAAFCMERRLVSCRSSGRRNSS